MKLIVQIPCHNEAEALGATLAAIPRQIDGIDAVEIVVVDDGSTDETVAIARREGVEHIVRFARQRGLARAFKAGLAESLRQGADIIVNTDGDNQYEGADIPKLAAPILAGEADIVIGDRNTAKLAHFSVVKKLFQKLGSWAMRRLSGTTIADAPSGFRAYSREAALRINVVTDFTYTLETLIQAGKRRMAVVDVPVRTHPTPRSSRLAKTMGHYVAQAGGAMARTYALYEPLKIFAIGGGMMLVIGVALGARFLYYRFWVGNIATGMSQSLILAAILSIIGFMLLTVAILADLLATNRRLLEETLYRIRKLELDPRRGAGPSTRPEVPEEVPEEVREEVTAASVGDDPGRGS
ncbi:MAG: glycosyltransferase family 2 protein [Acidobacteria bacterium]|nr:glycosyltransferase family 2 protein [Acidobacteriota bacterium]